ncbi:hypothetical protein SCORR_v1c10220 (plasmid) [Spiroplasma corruscae]|uniref:Uncharacterized protein n=1 Tax=Spiroplasma corruscae TaxID=216934 RepID=A0A222ERF5_9MOLU|nr:hypothetical protein [Spiroplasma corruscae]ASP28794.1 hypothetical protein SCORR_v1c10220 [Spiroplasma corruscae]
MLPIEKYRNFESLAFQYQEKEDLFYLVLKEIDQQKRNNKFTYVTTLRLKYREHFGIFLDILKYATVEELINIAKPFFKKYREYRKRK